MLNNKYYLGEYYQENSIIHKLNTTIKLFAFFILLLSIIIATSTHSIILLNLTIITIILYSNIDINIYLKTISSTKIILLILFILSLLLTQNILLSFYNIIKLIYIIILILTLTMTTKPLELNESLSKILNNKFIHAKKLVLNITLFLMALPLINETKEEIKISKYLRGLDNQKLSLKEKVKASINNLEPIIRLTKQKVQRIKTIMDIKNYSYHKKRTNYLKKELKLIDKLILLVSILIFILVIIY